MLWSIRPALLGWLLSGALVAVSASADDGFPRLIRRGNTTQLVVDGRTFIMLAGELHNSSSSSLEYMKPVWPRLKALHLNTVLATVSWELIEPREGQFDFTLIDGLVREARANDLKLVLLWFGTWKNASSWYVPAWVKTDTQRFPRLRDPMGPGSRDAISAFSEEACRADARAFAALMRHVREIDSREHTVIMVQVENEVGVLGMSRDRHPLAEEAFAGPVPPELMDYLKKHEPALLPEIADRWKAHGRRESGTWAHVFGPGAPPKEYFGDVNGADEVFSAWHVARYVGRVAEAGRKEHDLPMFANAWLVQHPGQQPGRFPSGGPVAGMMDVWRAAAPAIDLIAPDIYLDDFKGVTASYTRSGNPLLIPEASRGDLAAAHVFWAVGQHGAICFAPFGIDSLPPSHPLGRSYRFLEDLLPAIADHQANGRVAGILQADDEDHQQIELGEFRLRVRFEKRQAGRLPGCGLVIAVADDEYLIGGSNFSVEFQPRRGDGLRADYLCHEEGRMVAGNWVPGRRMNGDEYHVRIEDEPSLRRVRLYTYR